jgi:A/G-specific adenine glycosylase
MRHLPRTATIAVTALGHNRNDRGYGTRLPPALRLPVEPSRPSRRLASDRLLAWYEAERRGLPWRATRAAWPVWVSEVMLQQTRVETVLGYFGRFLERFPDPETLASSSEADLLALWSGLGYYRRARALKAGAAEVVALGAIPRSAVELGRLPGVGEYTAAAIASIAFGEPVPVVDGNVARVASRVLALEQPIGSAAAQRAARGLAAELLDPARPGDSNQALMELGATLCTPRRPRCPDCPLAADCRAHAAGEPERFPRRGVRRKPLAVALSAAAVELGGRYLLVRRDAEETLLPGLWELPACAGETPEPDAFAARYGGSWKFGAARGRVRHAITYRALSITAFEASWTPAEIADSDAAGWFGAAEAQALPLTGAARKLIRLLERGA